MKPERAESGAIATLVAVFLATGVLLGFLALSVDVGRTVLERRELQNGADAAVLSLAQSCAQGACDEAQIQALVDGNATDLSHGLELVCGTGLAAECPEGDASIITQCPAIPADMSGVPFVEVHTRTDSNDESFITNILGGAAGGRETSAVNTCARAAWGPPGNAVVFPITFSECEYTSAIDDENIGYGNVPIDEGDPWRGEIALALKYHPSKVQDPCVKAMHSGKDAPGAFGWLQADNSIADRCAVPITADGEATRQPGKPSKSGCEIAAGDTVMLPIYDHLADAKTYSIAGFAAFYVTALQGLNGEGVKNDSIGPGYPGVSAEAECDTESVNGKGCIFGWFLDDYIDFTGTIDPGGTSYGVTVVQPLG